MSGIAKLSEKMKKKITFSDYSFPQTQQQKPQKSRVMYTISSADMALLVDLFEKRKGTQDECSLSDLMSEAIQLFHQFQN